MRPKQSHPQPKPLPHPGQGIAVISERESLGDGFYKLHLLRALRRAYPGEAIDWYVSEGPSPYGGIMAPIVARRLPKVVPFAGFRRPRLRAMPPPPAPPPPSPLTPTRPHHAVG